MLGWSILLLEVSEHGYSKVWRNGPKMMVPWYSKVVRHLLSWVMKTCWVEVSWSTKLIHIAWKLSKLPTHISRSFKKIKLVNISISLNVVLEAWVSNLVSHSIWMKRKWLRGSSTNEKNVWGSCRETKTNGMEIPQNLADMGHWASGQVLAI